MKKGAMIYIAPFFVIAKYQRVLITIAVNYRPLAGYFFNTYRTAQVKLFLQIFHHSSLYQ